MHRLRRSWIPGLVLAVLLGSLVAAGPTPQATAAPPPLSTLVAIRAASHLQATPRYERVVFEFRGPVPQTDVRYVRRLIADGSGLPVNIAGQAILQVTMRLAQAHNAQGRVTAPARLTLGLRTVKAVARAGDFEGVLTYGIGLAQRPQIRVITLTQPSRVVVDVLRP